MFFPVRYAAWRQLLLGLVALSVAVSAPFCAGAHLQTGTGIKKGVGKRRAYLLEHSP